MKRVYIMACVDEDRFDELCTCNDVEMFGVIGQEEVRAINRSQRPFLDKEIFKKSSEADHLKDKASAFSSLLKGFAAMLKDIRD